MASRYLHLLPRYTKLNPESMGPITSLLTKLIQTDELPRTASKAWFIFILFLSLFV